MISQLRTEVLSGDIDDLAHVVSIDMLSDCLTKSSAKPDALIQCIAVGELPNCDKHPPFRELMKNRHKAYFLLEQFICENIAKPKEVLTFLSTHVQRSIHKYLAQC